MIDEGKGMGGKHRPLTPSSPPLPRVQCPIEPAGGPQSGRVHQGGGPSFICGCEITTEAASDHTGPGERSQGPQEHAQCLGTVETGGGGSSEWSPPLSALCQNLDPRPWAAAWALPSLSPLPAVHLGKSPLLKTVPL